MSKTKQCIFNIDEEDLRDLHIAAKEQDLTASQVLRKLVRQYLLNLGIAKKSKISKK